MTTIKSFEGLAAAMAEQKIAVRSTSPVAARVKKKERRQAPAVRAKTAESVTPQPTQARFDEVIGMLVAVIDGAFASRGVKTSAFADHAVACLAAEQARKQPDLTPEKSVIRALEAIVIQAGVPSRGVYTAATRGRRLLQMLEDTPAVVDGQLIKVSSRGELVAVERERDAHDALTVYEALSGCEAPRDFFKDLEIAKATREESLRDARMRRLRHEAPDIGVALVAAALHSCGFTSAGLPAVNFQMLGFNALNWSIAVMGDLRHVLETDDPFQRGQLFLAHVESGMEYDEFAELHKAVMAITPADGAGPAELARIRGIREADPDNCDSIVAAWKALQEELEVTQQEAINIVDRLLHFLRSKLAAREQRAAARAERGSAPDARRGHQAAPRPVAPAPRAKSVATPREALAALATTTEIETEMAFPTAKIEMLEVAAAELRKEFVTAGVDGARECPIYPGVVWEAVMGPVFHALDVSCDDNADAVVIIAPRRVGGMGLNLKDARVIMLREYEDFFTPAPAH